jgi:hypothetical protein
MVTAKAGQTVLSIVILAFVIIIVLTKWFIPFSLLSWSAR